MKIWIGIFLIFVLVIITSKLKINIKYLKKEKNEFKVRFDINLGWYLFGFCKIFGISLKEDAVYFLWFKIPYNTMKIEKDSIKMLKDVSVWDFFKSLKLRLEQLKIHLKIGCEDAMLTVFSVFAISTFLSILLARNAKQINQNNYYYQITPIYNANAFQFEICSQISIQTFNLLKAFHAMNRREKDKKVCQIHVKKVPIKI